MWCNGEQYKVEITIKVKNWDYKIKLNLYTYFSNTVYCFWFLKICTLFPTKSPSLMWRSQFWLHCTWTVIAALTLDTSCLRVEPLASVFSKCRCPFIHPGFPWRTLVWTQSREKVRVCVFCVCHSHRRDQSVMVYSAVMVPNTFSSAAP